MTTELLLLSRLLEHRFSIVGPRDLNRTPDRRFAISPHQSFGHIPRQLDARLGLDLEGAAECALPPRRNEVDLPKGRSSPIDRDSHELFLCGFRLGKPPQSTPSIAMHVE